MKLQLLSAVDSKAAAKKIDVAEATFGRQFNEALVHQVVVAWLAGARQGTRAQKSRADVQGGGRKPFRQKGTGRARAGTIRSPIWRGGGITFAARPQDHTQKVNKKMYRGAMQAILSELVRQERLVVIQEFSVPAPSTKEVVAQLKALALHRVLLVVEKLDKNLYLAARNLRGLEVIDVQGVNPVNLIGAEKVLFTLDALKATEGAFA